MTDRLEREYEGELAAVRQLSKEFAQRRPGIAARLMISDVSGVSQDPHVERLIEAAAFLTARIQVKLKDEFPELIDSLLEALYPHYLAPIPSMAVAQLQLDPSQASLTTGPVLPKGTALHSREISGIPVRFRTTMPVTLWPLAIVKSRYESSPFSREIVPPPTSRDAEALLRIELKCQGSAPISKLDIRSLRLFLSGDPTTTHQLYELLTDHVTNVLVRVPGAPQGRDSAALPASAVQPVGFGEDEGMLPYGPRSFPGYRLLSEYFAFPQKFLFLDVAGLECLQKLPAQDSIELILFVDKALPMLETRVKDDTFRLCCTPIVNLFKHSAEPIRLSRTRNEYLVQPDGRRPLAMEIYSIDGVESVHPDTKEVVQFQPFYSVEHDAAPNGRRAYWHQARRPSLAPDDPGTDVYLSLVDSQFDPAVPATDVLLVQATCTNRNLTSDVQKTGTVDWQFQLAGQSPVKRILTPVEPTRPLRLPERTHRWRLMSHLMLNHLSLTGGSDGAAALREMLRLYDYKGDSSSAQQIDGISLIETARGVAPIREAQVRGFCRGLDVQVTFDDEKYPGTGFFLLASVLDRFLAQYATINSFTRFTARSKQREFWEKRWPPRTGNLTLA